LDKCQFDSSDLQSEFVYFDVVQLNCVEFVEFDIFECSAEGGVVGGAGLVIVAVDRVGHGQTRVLVHDGRELHVRQQAEGGCLHLQPVF